MTDIERAATEYVAAMTDDELSVFIDAARKPAQLSQEDVHQLFSERRYDEIEAARVGGRLAAVVGVPQPQIDLVNRAKTLASVSRADLRELNRLGYHDLVAAYGAHTDRITD